MMLEIDLKKKKNDDNAYKRIDDSMGHDSFLYNDLHNKLKQENISEEALMSWSQFVKLAPSDAKKINDLAEFAVIKILRSWKSIAGIIQLDRPSKEELPS